MVKRKLLIASYLLCFSAIYASPAIVSVSTNGKYALTADYNKHAYLYDLDKKSVKDLGDDYNPLSASFIPNTDMYLLQKDDNSVVIYDTSQKEIKSFKVDILVKGDAINKDLSLFAYADSKSNMYIKNLKLNKTKDLFVSWCYGKSQSPYWRGNPYEGDMPNGCAHLNSELPEFKFIGNDKLISSFVSSLYIYDFDDKGIHWEEVSKNVGQTMNAIDPNGKFVYTADDRAMGIKYDLDNQKAIEFTDNTANPANYRLDYLNKSIKPIPYFIENRKPIGKLSNFKFIDNNKIVSTLKGTSQPFLWLGLYDYDIQQKNIGKDYHFATMPLLKYLPLVNNPMDYITGNYTTGADAKPYPSTSGYNTTFDTSVEAHKLVMAEANGNGIMVYNYNPSDESLKLDWVAEPPKAEEKKEESKGWFW